MQFDLCVLLPQQQEPTHKQIIFTGRRYPKSFLLFYEIAILQICSSVASSQFTLIFRTSQVLQILQFLNTLFNQQWRCLLLTILLLFFVLSSVNDKQKNISDQLLQVNNYIFDITEVLLKYNQNKNTYFSYYNKFLSSEPIKTEF